jgi:hypothetical protein
VLPWSIAAVAVVVLVGALASNSFESGPAPGAAPVAPFAGGAAGGAPPDISQMSPEERADRLFNRVMSYAERGMPDSAAFFAPMAMMAYQALGTLSGDQRYHLGAIGLATGDPAGAELAKAQADSMLQQDPDYLLGLMLGARSAEARGDKAAQQRFEQRFLRVLDKELARKLEEYEGHRASIAAAAEAYRGSR